MTMPLERIPDWEMRIARQDAWWNCEIIDRPVVSMQVGKSKLECPWPEHRQWATTRDRWMDAEYQASLMRACALNTNYYGEALPNFNPNLGPDITAAYMGCELEFGEGTSWSIPNLLDWADADKLQFSPDNLYFKKIEEMTDAFLEAGKGIFYSGVTDIHTGADMVAAFRDPANLNMDLIDEPEAVQRLLGRCEGVITDVFERHYAKLRAADQPCVNWSGVVSNVKWCMTSDDFSCMISKKMWDKIFLPIITREAQRLDATLYHLDGPNALRHLDSLLSIEKLNAIQWVYGAGNGRSIDWLPVYQKCQAAGKGIQILGELADLDILMANLKPEGVWLSLGGVPDDETALAVLRKLENWK
ncbi:MAG: uroporphyrinogen decarboxylase/cobalamine-independent methonine synthase family protein [Armatimonadota bacterium]